MLYINLKVKHLSLVILYQKIMNLISVPGLNIKLAEFLINYVEKGEV